MYDNNLHNWEVISLHMITQKLGKKFLFCSNLDVSIVSHNIIRKFSENGKLQKPFGSINTLRSITNLYAIIV